MSHLLARPKPKAPRRREQSQPHLSKITTMAKTSSGQKPRAVKKAPYLDRRYELILQTKGIYLHEAEDGITEDSKSICGILLNQEQTYPHGTLFRQATFTKLCSRLRDRNEPRVVQDISRLIVPSAETLAMDGDSRLDILVESVNEGWNKSIPITETRPQPDYSVGFDRSAFTNDQLEHLKPFVKGYSEKSYCMGTYYMYFPFLACEAKCGASALNVADRQNAHSMALAVRGVVELFRQVKRETELHRKLLAFSISHDHSFVRIYGHYPVIDGKETRFYRHTIRQFDFTELEGREKWTTYRFTKNLYIYWMPEHIKLICSAVDQLPGVNFEGSALAKNEEIDEVDLQLLQNGALHMSQQSEPEPMAIKNEPSQPDLVDSRGSSLPLSNSHWANHISNKRKRSR